MKEKPTQIEPEVFGDRCRRAGIHLFRWLILSAVGICFSAVVPVADAGDFDGSRALSGITEKIIEVNRFRIIDNVDPDTIGLPKTFLIDFNARILRPGKDSLIKKTITFNSLVHIENKMILQGVDKGVEGVDDGLAWSLAISKKDGKAVLSASGDGVAYVVFGSCRPVSENR